MLSKCELKGFTIVETLVVIAIICVLAAIAFSISGPARERSRQSVCTSQLRQLFVAVSLYSIDVGAGEEVSGLGDFSCVVARGGLPQLLPYLREPAIRHCPDLPTVISQKLATSYHWMPVPHDLFPNPTPGETSMLREQEKNIDRMGTSFPMWSCRIHDEMYYSPQERHINDVLARPFVIEVSVSGSLYAGRSPIRGLTWFPR